MDVKPYVKLMTRTGYFDRFYQIAEYFDTNKEAYEALENECYDNLGVHHYSSYESFKTNKYKYVRQITHKSTKETEGYTMFVKHISYCTCDSAPGHSEEER